MTGVSIPPENTVMPGFLGAMPLPLAMVGEVILSKRVKNKLQSTTKKTHEKVGALEWLGELSLNTYEKQ